MGTCERSVARRQPAWAAEDKWGHGRMRTAWTATECGGYPLWGAVENHRSEEAGAVGRRRPTFPLLCLPSLEDGGTRIWPTCHAIPCSHKLVVLNPGTWTDSHHCLETHQQRRILGLPRPTESQTGDGQGEDGEQWVF